MYYSILMPTHLDMVVAVVVEVEDAVELALPAHVQLLGALHPLAQRLPRVLLHLDVVELPAMEGVLDTRIYDCFYKRD